MNGQESTLERLAGEGSAKAAYAAFDYLHLQGVSKETLRGELMGVLSTALKANINAALPGAVNDAKEAVEAGMGGFAKATFIASLQLAGIKAAQEVLAGVK